MLDDFHAGAAQHRLEKVDVVINKDMHRMPAARKFRREINKLSLRPPEARLSMTSSSRMGRFVRSGGGRRCVSKFDFTRLQQAPAAAQLAVGSDHTDDGP